MTEKDRGLIEDLGALSGHILAALVVVDRMNARRAGTITVYTRRELVDISHEIESHLDDLWGKR